MRKNTRVVNFDLPPSLGKQQSPNCWKPSPGFVQVRFSPLDDGYGICEREAYLRAQRFRHVSTNEKRTRICGRRGRKTYKAATSGIALYAPDTPPTARRTALGTTSSARSSTVYPAISSLQQRASKLKDEHQKREGPPGEARRDGHEQGKGGHRRPMLIESEICLCHVASRG